MHGGRVRKAVIVASILLAATSASGLVLAEQPRDATAAYVVGVGAPSPVVCAFSEDSGAEAGNESASTAPVAVGVNGVCLDVSEEEDEVELAIDDIGASNSDAVGPVCAHYTFHGEDASLGSGVFEGQASLALPAGTERLSIYVGHSHDPGMLGLGWTDCADQKGTAGQIHATFR